MSADTAKTHSGDKIKLGSVVTARLVHRRRSSAIRYTINSNTTNAICGCLLSAQSVIHSERSHTRPCRQTALKQSAVTSPAGASGAACWENRALAHCQWLPRECTEHRQPGCSLRCPRTAGILWLVLD